MPRKRNGFSTVPNENLIPINASSPIIKPHSSQSAPTYPYTNEQLNCCSIEPSETTNVVGKNILYNSPKSS